MPKILALVLEDEGEVEGSAVKWEAPDGVGALLAEIRQKLVNREPGAGNGEFGLSHRARLGLPVLACFLAAIVCSRRSSRTCELPHHNDAL